MSVTEELCLESQKSSLIFLEDKEKLDFVTTRLQMVLNDSSLYTHKARKDILDNYLGFDGAMKQHIFIGSYSLQLENLTPPSKRSVSTDCDKKFKNITFTFF